MKFIINAIVTLTLAMQFSAPRAAPVPPSAKEGRVIAMYAVSGLLRNKSDGSIVKLVQGLAYGPTRQDAVAAFTSDVLAKYPEYSLMDTVASSLTVPNLGCGLTI